MIKKIALIFVVTTSLFSSYTMDYDKNTTGIVRKLKVYKEPKWVSKIELTNGKKLFFVSPKSMIEFYHQPGKWSDIGVKSEVDFKDLIVTDHATLKPVNAKTAFFVYGSNQTSPAGDDLVAFEKEEDAKRFLSSNNGKRILTFQEVKLSLINLLNGRI